MKIQLGLGWRLALSFIVLALLSQYLNHQSFDDLLKVAVHHRESDKIKTISKIIEPRMNHDIHWVKSLSQLLNHELSLAMRNKGEARKQAVATVLDRAYVPADIDTLEVTDENGIVLYRAHAPELSGELSTTWGIEEALAGQGNAVGKREQNGALILFVEPLRDGEKILGTISSGKRIGEQFIKTLSAETGLNWRWWIALLTLWPQATEK